MDVIICNTLWYLIRPIGRLLKIIFCEMWRIILCLQCRVHVKDYVSKAITYGWSDSQKDFLKSVKHQKILMKQKIIVFFHVRRKHDVNAMLSRRRAKHRANVDFTLCVIRC